MKRFIVLVLVLSITCLPLEARRRWIPKIASAGSSPAFVREALRLNVDAGFSTSTAMPLTGATTIPAGHRAVIALAVSSTVTVTSVTDNAGGNSWVVDLTGNSAGQSGIAIASCVLSTQLTSAQTITVNFSGAAAFAIAASLIDITGTTAVDVTAGVTHSFATTVSLSGSTTAANTLVFGVFTNDSNGTYTYSGSNWTIIGANENFSNSSSRICAFAYKPLSSSGSQNPGGTWTTGNVDQVNGWVAYK